ncbi:MAG: serine/threonine protein kinase, partial [Chloroflexi bacterium]
MSDSLIGQKIGQYTILSKIGEGGMAKVYRAYQPSISRYVAIKVLPENVAGDRSFIKRFKAEARAIAALEHPHILPLYDFGTENGITYMVMRLVDGGTLADLLDETPVPPRRQTVQIIADVAGALDYAHRENIVHRDVKPSNILIDQHGQVLLMDFGLARAMNDTAQSRITRTGTVVGTATYMSPEQAADEKLDGRSDVYSLGVVLFEMLTGQTPFTAETMVAIALKHINEPTPSLREINPDIPQIFEDIVFKAMQKWPADRYQTAGELARDLQRALSTLKTEDSLAAAGRVPSKLPTLTAQFEENAATAGPHQPARAPSGAISGTLSVLKQPWLWGSIIAATLTTVAVIAVLVFWLRAA